MVLAHGSGGHPYWWADVLRIVFVLLPGGASAAIAVVVVARYAKVYRSVARSGGGWLGMLPRHVVGVGLSYLILVGWGIVDTCRYFHHPVTGRVPVYAVAFCIGAVAMWDVLGYENHRLHRL